MGKKLAVAGLLLGFLTASSPMALGYEWILGEDIKINLKGDLTYWARVRTETPYPAFVTTPPPPAVNPTYCEGNANFDKGALTNNAVIGTLELRADIPYHTLFGRIKGLYDFAYDDKGKFHSDEMRRHAAYNITDALEYYLEGNYGFLTYRIGKQIIQWGESTAPLFAPGVNVVSPFFMQRIANAGYTFRDWQVPTNMLWISVDPYSTLAYEFVYAPDFDPRFYLPVVGTFNSPTDAAGFGADPAKTDDQRPTEFKDKQQWGGAIRLVLPDLSYLELGLYYYHYLARFPLMSMPPSLVGPLTMEYPETDMVGLSFVNTIQAYDLNLQINGELAYRPNDPLQKNSFLSVIMAQFGGGMPAIPGGWERANTLTWGLGASRFFHDVLDFTPWTFKLSPVLELYGKINLDHSENKFFTDPQSMTFYSINLPLECPDMIDNAVVYFEAQALGNMFSEKSRLHHFVFTARGRYGNNWEILLGYDLVIGNPAQDPAGIFMWDRDAFTCKVTYNFI